VTVQFAEFTLDLGARQLLHRDRGEIRLSPKAFDLLAALIEQRYWTRPTCTDGSGPTPTSSMPT
jgi:DNA-binding response OmpR family regulator